MSLQIAILWREVQVRVAMPARFQRLATEKQNAARTFRENRHPRNPCDFSTSQPIPNDTYTTAAPRRSVLAGRADARRRLPVRPRKAPARRGRSALSEKPTTATL